MHHSQRAPRKDASTLLAPTSRLGLPSRGQLRSRFSRQNAYTIIADLGGHLASNETFFLSFQWQCRVPDNSGHLKGKPWELGEQGPASQGTHAWHFRKAREPGAVTRQALFGRTLYQMEFRVQLETTRAAPEPQRQT